MLSPGTSVNFPRFFKNSKKEKKGKNARQFFRSTGATERVSWLESSGNSVRTDFLQVYREINQNTGNSVGEKLDELTDPVLLEYSRTSSVEEAFDLLIDVRTIPIVGQ